jgi:hypothetical protein
VAKIKHNANGKILRNINEKIVNSCGEVVCGCEDGTFGSIYRISVPADTFTGPCAAFFNGNTFDVDADGTFAVACCPSVDISGLGCAEEGFGSSVTACFSEGGIVVSFTIALGETVNFFWENSAGGNHDCAATRTADWLQNSGVSNGLLSEAGKTVDIAKLL